MIQCSKCLQPFHKKCIIPPSINEKEINLFKFTCPTCELLSINSQNKKIITNFLFYPTKIFRDNEKNENNKTFSIHIGMDDLISIKKRNVYLVLSCQEISLNKTVFRWPKYCNIFINGKRLIWDTKEFDTGDLRNPFIFSFEDEKEDKINFNFFCDFFFVDELNKIEIKKTFWDNAKEKGNFVYVLSLMLCYEGEGNYKKEQEMKNNQEICFCQKEIETLDKLDQDGAFEIINLCENGDDEEIVNCKEKDKRNLCELCKKFRKNKKNKNIIID